MQPKFCRNVLFLCGEPPIRATNRPNGGTMTGLEATNLVLYLTPPNRFFVNGLRLGQRALAVGMAGDVLALFCIHSPGNGRGGAGAQTYLGSWWVSFCPCFLGDMGLDSAPFFLTTAHLAVWSTASAGYFYIGTCCIIDWVTASGHY